MPKLEYPVIIEPLPLDEGGGFVALVPDLPGCMSDGDTGEAALTSVQDAVAAWIDRPAARVLARRHHFRWWEVLPWLAAIGFYFAFPDYLGFGTELLIAIAFARIWRRAPAIVAPMRATAVVAKLRASSVTAIFHCWKMLSEKDSSQRHLTTARSAKAHEVVGAAVGNA